jgi:hypothetical protein
MGDTQSRYAWLPLTKSSHSGSERLPQIGTARHPENGPFLWKLANCPTHCADTNAGIPQLRPNSMIQITLDEIAEHYVAQSERHPER